ncbi:MAG: 30S ribosomal protein S20 [Pseudomonadota bacterium]
MKRKHKNHSLSINKQIRRNERRRIINRNRISRIRTAIRRVHDAIASGDTTAAQTALKQAQPEISRGVTKAVLHKNTAARTISRLSKRVAKLA